MENNEKFITRMFHFIGGRFHLIEEEFHKLEDAISAGLKSLCHSWKVYDHHGKCHHDGSNHEHNHDDNPY